MNQQDSAHDKEQEEARWAMVLALAALDLQRLPWSRWLWLPPAPTSAAQRLPDALALRCVEPWAQWLPHDRLPELRTMIGSDYFAALESWSREVLVFAPADRMEVSLWHSVVFRTDAARVSPTVQRFFTAFRMSHAKEAEGLRGSIPQTHPKGDITEKEALHDCAQLTCWANNFCFHWVRLSRELGELEQQELVTLGQEKLSTSWASSAVLSWPAHWPALVEKYVQS